ncbi:MAG TPA: nucleotidyltransferase domain-containing protein [Candidatus Nanoarchaeia archaeon]|nr:nucleotidyltransferase domain-containing protein [Candidatus Nanoarchaeia archaeon]
MDNLNNKTEGYAIDFVSFIIQKTKRIENIKNIILFGSVARQEADEKSDVDIFIDVVEESKLFEEEIENNRESFTKSIKYKNYWEPLGITAKINTTIGKLTDWKELQTSIYANGITLYGKFHPSKVDGKHLTFFIWENIKPNAKRVLLNKQLYGYKQKSKFYPGLIQKYNGERIGKGCILVPIEHANLFHALYKRHKVAVKIKKVIEY